MRETEQNTSSSIIIENIDYAIYKCVLCNRQFSIDTVSKVPRQKSLLIILYPERKRTTYRQIKSSVYVYIFGIIYQYADNNSEKNANEMTT